MGKKNPKHNNQRLHRQYRKRKSQIPRQNPNRDRNEYEYHEITEKSPLIPEIYDPIKPRCGLCGKQGRLIKTECCNQWICDDSDQYEMFSYSRNSCFRNHSHYTLCSHHYNEDHMGNWKDCKQCAKDFEPETEMYVWYGTNEYNFETLTNPPDYDPTYCEKCKKRINLGEDGYSVKNMKYYCEKCGVF